MMKRKELDLEAINYSSIANEIKEISPIKKMVIVNADNDFNNKTLQENKRDEKITFLLEEYLNSYKSKTGFIKIYKKRLFNISITWGTALVVMIVWLPIAYYFLSDKSSTVDVVGIITSIATFAGLIFGLLKIITSYIFSPDDEKNITTIVQAIQQNDLENKKLNLKHKLIKEKIDLNNVEILEKLFRENNK